MLLADISILISHFYVKLTLRRCKDPQADRSANFGVLWYLLQ